MKHIRETLVMRVKLMRYHVRNDDSVTVEERNRIMDALDELQETLAYERNPSA